MNLEIQKERWKTVEEKKGKKVAQAVKRFVILGKMPTVYGIVAVTSQSMG